MLYLYWFLMELRKGGTTANAAKYAIVSLLSRHPDSTVWLATHKTLHVERIIKGIRKTSTFHDRLVKEAHLLKNLNNPHIPKIYDLEEDDEYTYIIEEYIAGESLKSLCNRRLLSEKEIIHFIFLISSIIDYLHTLPGNGLLYLDIKPENVLISGDNCYLVDFGSAQNEDDEAGFIFGTRSYAPPEQINGEKLSKKADIYALGMLLKFMLSHGSVTRKKEAQLQAVVRKCTGRTVWSRFSSVRALMTKIKEIDKGSSSFVKKPLKIAFAGAAPNTGVTYIALTFAAYLKSLGRKCVYAEMNDSEAWYSISPRINELRALAGLEVLSRKFCENRDITDADIISDYGRLSEAMPESFYDADISCILIGNRIWETDEIKQTRALSKKCNKRLFLVNLTGTVDRDIAEMLNTEAFMAIPYINNPDEIFKDAELKTVFQELALKTGVMI